MIDRPASRVRAAAVLIGALSLSPSGTSRAERDRGPSLLLGGAARDAPPPAPLDPHLPGGARRASAARPSPSASVVCGMREPVCVHPGPGGSMELARAYVAALERARARLVGAMGLPPPLADVTLGGSPDLDLYLMDDLASDAAPSGNALEELAPFDVALLDVRVEPDAAITFDDRRSAFCSARAARRELERQATLCVGEAILLGLDAAETPALRRGIASYWWRLLGAPGERDMRELDLVQANPQLGFTAPDAAGAAASLFFEHLDRRLGAGTPGVLPAALAQIARGATPAGRPRFDNEPDLFDVLYRAFASSRQSFDDFMLGFAVERAFAGARDPGARHPELAWLGDAGRVRFDWVLKASSLPRRVAPRRPLEPMGSAYVWLELDRVTLGKALAFRAEWEAPSAMRWALVSVDARGRPLRRLDLPFVKTARFAERMLEDHDGAAGVLIAGINLGGIDLAHPFDPDHEPFEPHGFTLYVTEL